LDLAPSAIQRLIMLDYFRNFNLTTKAVGIGGGSPSQHFLKLVLENIK